MGKYLAVYLLIANGVGFLLCGWDKRCAKRGRWRTPERTLLAIALCGGALGLLIGMRVFHHKTKHKKFTFGVPLMLLLWVGGLILLQSTGAVLWR